MKLTRRGLFAAAVGAAVLPKVKASPTVVDGNRIRVFDPMAKDWERLGMLLDSGEVSAPIMFSAEGEAGDLCIGKALADAQAGCCVDVDTDWGEVTLKL